MLADPISVAAAAPNPALVLAITRSDNYGSERVDTGGNGYSTIINHTKSKSGNRHYIQLILTKDVENPYTSVTSSQKASVSVSISRPPFGFSDTDLVNLYKALTDTIGDTEVTVAKLVQFQS